MAGIVKISFVDLADVVLVEDIVDLLFLVDGEYLPVRVNSAAAGTKDDFAARMLFDEIGDVVDCCLANDPLAVVLSCHRW